MIHRLKNLNDVVAWRLCVGCGACAFACPQKKVWLWDFVDEGIRPRVDPAGCGPCRICLEICPALQAGAETADDALVVPDSIRADEAPRFFREWGPVLEIWEGHAVDEEIRFKGSSGGVLTALGLYGVEQAGLHGVLHVGPDPANPVRNRTRLSRTREELVQAMGSRYSPAAVCDQLDLIERAPAPCAMIGKPAEIAALRRLEAARPALAGRIALTLSFFCAETPSTAGTLALLRKLDIPRRPLATLRYRGHGWPGNFTPILQGETEPRAIMPYRGSWSFLQHFRPWSVQLWPDSTGEQADLCCGDPWYESPDGRNPGFSLLVVRSERGRRFLHGAMRAGYLSLKPAEPSKLMTSQLPLLKKKRELWGRLLALAIFGLPAPGLKSRTLRQCWWAQPAGEKLRSVGGTIRRILLRRLYRRLRLDDTRATPVQPGFIGTHAATAEPASPQNS